MTAHAITLHALGGKGAPRLGAAGRAAMRVLIWIALWAEALRTLAAVAGVWSGGSWGIVATLFVGVLAPAWMFLVCPTWLAWRVFVRHDQWRETSAHRLRTRFVQELSRLAVVAGCWLSPLCKARDLPGIQVFLRIQNDRAFPHLHRVPADAWTILALALQADRQGNLVLADQIVDALVCLPAGARFTWLARVHGGEALVRSAMARRDWAMVRRYATLGRGRVVRFLSTLAEAHSGGRPSRYRLWSQWALAPGRVRAWRLARATSALLRAPVQATPPPVTPPSDARVDIGIETIAEVRTIHVHYLGRAAQGQPIELRGILSLAAQWTRALDSVATARLHARALELDARDGAAAVAAIRARVLDELTALGTYAEGTLPAPDAVDDVVVDSLARELVQLIRAQLSRGVEEALAPLTARDGEALPPLQAWTRWLTLRSVLETVERRAGRVTLTLLWHGSIRDAVWQWATTLFNHRPSETAWMAHMVFAWLADNAEVIGDLGARLTNRENARIALAADARNPW